MGELDRRARRANLGEQDRDASRVSLEIGIRDELLRAELTRTGDVPTSLLELGLVLAQRRTCRVERSHVLAALDPCYDLAFADV